MVYRRRHEEARARGGRGGARRRRAGARVGVERTARALAGARAAGHQPGPHAPDARARAAGAGARPARALDAGLGAAVGGVAAPDPRRGRLRGPGLLRSRGRRLEGDPAVDREERREAALRARRQHDHAAAGEEPLLRHGEDAAAQAARAGRDALARGGPHEGTHPRALPQRDRVGRRRLRLRGRGPALVRQAGGGAHGSRGRRPRGDDPQPAPHQPVGVAGAPRAGDAARALADGAGRLPRPRRGAARRRASARADTRGRRARRAAARAARRRADAARARASHAGAARRSRLRRPRPLRLHPRPLHRHPRPRPLRRPRRRPNLPRAPPEPSGCPVYHSA